MIIAGPNGTHRKKNEIKIRCLCLKWQLLTAMH